VFIILLLIISISCYAQESQKSYTILLLDFEDKSGIENPLLANFNNTLIFVLSRQAGPVRVRLIPTSDRNSLLGLAKVMQPDGTPIERGLLAARKADADALVTGSYTKQGTKWSLQAEVYHLREGQKARQPIQIQRDSLYKLLDDFPAQLLKQFATSYIALTTSSWNAYEEFLKGHEAFENFNFFGALEHYEKALELDPTLALAYAEQSRVYFTTGQPQLATKAIEAAQKWIPKASPMEQLAIRVLADTWDTEQNGYRDIGAAGFTTGGSGDIIFNLAPGGVWDEALIHAILAHACTQEGKHTEAAQHNQWWFEAIQRRIRAHPDDVSLLYNAAKYCLAIGQYLDEAIDMELKVIELRPKWTPWRGPRHILSRLYVLQGNIEQSLDWAGQHIQLLRAPVPEFTNHRKYMSTWDHLAASLHEGKIPPERLLRWCKEALRIPGLHQPYCVRTQYLMADIYHALIDDV